MVIEVGPGADEHRVLFEGTWYPTASRLASWVERFGGYVGELSDPTDREKKHVDKKSTSGTSRSEEQAVANGIAQHLSRPG
jgi:hypothetical protein